MQPGQLVESYKFWDVVALWASERLENPTLIARALARGVVVDGLRVQSIDPRWQKTERALDGRPYVGYAADPEKPPVLLRLDVLEHLLSVVRQAATPSPELMAVEFVLRDDFRAWLQATGQPLPAFWYTAAERAG